MDKRVSDNLGPNEEVPVTLPSSVFGRVPARPANEPNESADPYGFLRPKDMLRKMATIREATVKDFEGVHALLRECESAPHVTRDQWLQLFVDRTGLQRGKFGYVMVDDDAVVGFIATTLSEREVRGRIALLCNMSNCVVKAEYRDQSVALLSKVLSEKDVTITNLSPTPNVLEMSEELNLTLLEKAERIVVPAPAPRGLPPCRVIVDPYDVARLVDGEQARIVRDHCLPYNRHALLRSRDGDCYVMYNRTYKTVRKGCRLPFARVHHVSDGALFARYAARLLSTVVAAAHVVAMIVEQRWLRGETIWHSFPRPGGARHGAFRSDTLAAEDIDGLYSEQVLLNY
jgi:hypothetical protein